MRYQKYIKILISILITGLLISCDRNLSKSYDEAQEIQANTQIEAQATNSPTPQTAQGLEVIDGCIQPFETFAYKISSDDTKPKPGRYDIVNLNSPWKVETTLKIPEGKEEFSWGRSNVIGAGFIDDNPEIWVENLYYYKNIFLGTYQTLSIYKPGTQEWNFVNIDFNTSDGIYYYISKLFFTGDGSIYGLITATSNFDSSNQSISILSKYNEELSRFEFDFNVNTIPIQATGFSDETLVLLGNNGDFWFIVRGDSIYHYDPLTAKLENRVSISSLHVSSAVLSRDNSSIYLMTYFPEAYPIQESQPYIYYVNENKIEQTSIPQELRFSYYSNMLFDHEGRLWLESVAWMDKDGEWFSLIQPTIFITNYTEAPVERWKTTKIMAETSDGRLWFVGPNGSTWLNFESQKWCWFTTRWSVPVEDALGGLWLVEDDKLYRSDVGQE